MQELAQRADKEGRLALFYWMLFYKRQYVIDKIKKPIMKALIVLANRLPDVTKENTVNANTHLWIDIWDRFFQMEDNPGREALFRAIRKVHLAEMEHDIYYAERMQVMLEMWLDEVLKGNWRGRETGHPEESWRHEVDEKGLGYDLIAKCEQSRRKENE